MTSVLQKKNAETVAGTVPAVVGDLSENLRRLDRLANLGLVSASVAHEIKNGLVGISTFVELLAQKGADAEMTNLARKELARINSLVTQMLRVSAPKPAALSRLQAHEILDHSLRLLEHQMQGRLILLTREYAAASDWVQADESQLQQALMNLLLNAVEAVGSNGEVKVSTVNQGGQLRILVHDTGPGITAANRERLFEPFFTTKKNGTGLGLAICRRVIEEHQGRIEVESVAGQGSTFIITLPGA